MSPRWGFYRLRVILCDGYAAPLGLDIILDFIIFGFGFYRCITNVQ